MKIAHLIKNLKLDDEGKKELDSILALPEVESILNREESTKIEKRKALIAELNGLPKKFEKRKIEAEHTAVEAAGRVGALTENLRRAKEDYNLAQAAAGALAAQQQRETWHLQQQLRDGADTRLQEFWRLLGEVDGAIRIALSVWPEKRKDWFGKPETVIHSNVEEMEAARAVIKAAIDDIESMSFEALSRSEVSERLASWTHKLEGPLRPFGMQPPGLDESDEVRMMPRVSNSEIIRRVSKAADLAA